MIHNCLADCQLCSPPQKQELCAKLRYMPSGTMVTGRQERLKLKMHCNIIHERMTVCVWDIASVHRQPVTPLLWGRGGGVGNCH